MASDDLFNGVVLYSAVTGPTIRPSPPDDPAP